MKQMLKGDCQIGQSADVRDFRLNDGLGDLPNAYSPALVDAHRPSHVRYIRTASHSRSAQHD